MSISDLYSSGAQKSNLGHFSNIVKLALADEKLEASEKELLDKMARSLQISEEKYKDILSNADKYAISPPNGYDERIERLYKLTQMIFADDEVTGAEMIVLRRIAIGLGFSTTNAEKVCDEAVHLVLNENDLEEFTEAIKAVNKSE
ncbi:TerB family tellurite resistance protein [Aureibaculum sp. 2210JD6-5]|uniref:TerB family tellurite resistance protein n=1 Tax=Aureibaculum sp. 2210JD6-5 TaxID=3103957 RepID=UPI002AACDCAE|nr:TerB family tellurite resistance protein [Aureibaculum sp. 2210JD6-5]MDY7395935.1 TerB family tellurite resistance protein [Aureibaculum sp. 2210JD6-5]